MSDSERSKRYAKTEKGKAAAARRRAREKAQRQARSSARKKQTQAERAAQNQRNHEESVARTAAYLAQYPQPESIEQLIANPEKYRAVKQFPQHLVDKDVLAFLPLFGTLTPNRSRYVKRLLSKIKPLFADIVGRLAKDFASGRPIDQWLHVGDSAFHASNAPIESGSGIFLSDGRTTDYYWDGPNGARTRLYGPETRAIHQYWEDRQRAREVELLKCLRLLRVLDSAPTQVDSLAKGHR